MSKIETYAKYAEKREDGSTIYYRTGKGSHRHAVAYCANSKRDIMTGDVLVIDPSEVDQWEPCADCCTEADVTAAAEKAQAKADTMCPNNQGVTNPQRIYSHCKVCGKEGKVMRGTGKIKAHKKA